MAGVVKGSVAFYWLISTYKLEQLSNWLISLHKRACGVKVGREQGGGHLLKFLGEADELTEITKRCRLIAGVLGPTIGNVGDRVLTV